MRKIREKHGMTKSREFWVWHSMRQRCNNPNDPRYADYGGRGIKVCDAWSNFSVFFCDMGPRPCKEYSLDRIDNNLGYYKENCRWSDRHTQAMNKRNIKTWTHDGRTQSVWDWCLELNLNSHSVSCRIKRGWDVERAIITPIVTKDKYMATWDNRTMNSNEWSKEIGISSNTVRKYLKQGFTIGDIINSFTIQTNSPHL